jgi:hypothetical protein
MCASKSIAQEPPGFVKVAVSAARLQQGPVRFLFFFLRREVQRREVHLPCALSLWTAMTLDVDSPRPVRPLK